MKLDFTVDKLVITKDDGTKLVKLVKDLTFFETAMWEYIASVDDTTPEQAGNSIVLNEKIDSLQKEVDSLKFKDATVVTPPSNPSEPVKFTDMTKDCTLKGAELKSSDINQLKAKSILVEDIKLESTKISMEAPDLIKVSSMELVGEYPSDRTGTLMDDPCWVGSPKTVEISGFKNDTESAWNGIFICHEQYPTAPSKVSISDCEFDNFKHNPIAIVSLEDNAKVTISNCKFNNCSFNNIRFSNFLNKSGITLDFVNCEFSVIPDGDKTGIFYLRDIKSTPEQEFNLFAPEKVTINLYYCKVNGAILTKSNFKMGTGDSSQILYVTQDKANGFVPYDESKYPTVNVY